jgi:CHAT domain-containing protein
MLFSSSLSSQNLHQLEKKADTYLNQFAYDSAAFSYYQISQNVLNKKKYPKTIYFLNKAANAYIRTGQFIKSQELIDTAFIYLKKYAIKNDSLRAYIFMHYGLLHMHQGNMNAAALNMERSVELYKHQKDQELRVVLLSIYLVNIYAQKFEYHQARKIGEYGIDLARRKLPANHIYIAYLHHNIGAVYEKSGLDKQALNSYKLAIEAYKIHFNDNHPYVASIYNNIAVIYNNQDAFSESISYLEKSIRILLNSESKNWEEIARVYSNLSVSYLIKKDYKKANELIDYAMNLIIKKINKDHAQLLVLAIMKAELLQTMKRYEESVTTLKQAEKKSQTLYKNSNFSLAEISTLLAESYFELSKVDSAKFYIKQANRIFNSNPTIHHFRKARYHLIRAKLAYQEEQYNQAIVEINLAIKKNLLLVHPELVLDNETYIQSLLFKISIDEKMGNKLQANANRYRLISFVETLLEDYHLNDSKYKLIENLTTVYDTMILQILEHKTNDNRTKVNELFLTMTKIKSMNLNSSINFKSFLEKNASELEKGLALELNTNIFSCREQILNITDTLKSDSIKDKLFSLLEKKFDLENKYKKMFNSKRKSNTFKEIGDLQERLNEDELFIEYYITNEKLIILCISKSEIHLDSIKINNAVLSKKIQDFLRSINKFEKTKYTDTASDLFQILLAKVQKLITHKKKLIIIPHGVLNKLPFEALLDKNNNFLINSFEITYHYSSAFIKKNKPSEAKEKSFLGFAPVLFNSPESFKDTLKDQIELNDRLYEQHLYLPDLRESEKELDAIESLFREKSIKTDIYTYQEATKSNFYNYSAHASIIHLATHSFVNLNNENYSSIIFSKSANMKENNDNILYSGEIYNLQVMADLIVLSSCETGIGKLLSNEGFLSLSRAFYYVGVQSILFSLWKVQDKSSKDLMILFYRFYLNGQNKSEALRSAKLEMIKNQPSSFPKNWAGFILIGN